MVAPAAPAAPEKKAAAPNQATIVVNLAADAKLLVDDSPVPTSGNRSFVTPDLDAGREYFYVFKAEAVRNGKTVTETKRITFRAGDVARVSFNDLDIPVSAPARVTVRLPEDAKLFVDNTLCTLTSGQRTFETPKLEPGREYFYTLKAEIVRDGQTQTDSKRVVVRAGKDTSVEFTTIGTVQAAQK